MSLPPSRCLGCDYVLVDTGSQRCPECWRPFDPADRHSVNLSGRPIGHARPFLRPIGWPMHVLAISALVVPLWIGRSPGRAFHAGMASSVLWGVTIALWSVRATLFLVLMQVFHRPFRVTWQSAARWMVLPALLIVAWTLPADAGMHCAFRMSHASLETLAHQAMCGNAESQSKRRAGLYVVTIASVSADEVRLFTGFGYDGDRYGFAYKASGRPQDTFWIRYRPLRGNWYQYAERASLILPATTAVAPTRDAPK